MSSDTRNDTMSGMIGLDMMTSMTQASIKAMEDWNKELSRFMSYRLEQDLAFQTDLASCKTPAEFFETYSTFMTKVMEDYAGQMQKMQGLTADMASTAFSASDADPPAPKPAPKAAPKRRAPARTRARK